MEGTLVICFHSESYRSSVFDLHVCPCINACLWAWMRRLCLFATVTKSLAMCGWICQHVCAWTPACDGWRSCTYLQVYVSGLIRLCVWLQRASQRDTALFLKSWLKSFQLILSADGKISLLPHLFAFFFIVWGVDLNTMRPLFQPQRFQICDMHNFSACLHSSH